MDENNLISGNVIAGIEIRGNSPGIYPGPADDNSVFSNKIGTSRQGDLPIPNAIGILVSGATKTAIGSLSAGQGNLISGNTGAGISIANASFVAITSSRLRILGNQVGTNVGGTALPNGIGVSLNESSDNTIQGNTIAGNRGNGLELLSFTDPLRPSARNQILGNFIGTSSGDVTGLGNGDNGILLQGNATNNTLDGNLIANNTGSGVEILERRLQRHAPTGRRQHPDQQQDRNEPQGTVAFPNHVGVLLEGAIHTIIGGLTPTDGNLISGNTGAGISITNVPLVTDTASFSQIKGNRIGTNAGVTAPLPNGIGVSLNESSDNTIQGNTIAGNRGNGLELLSFTDPLRPSARNQILGNFIGTSSGDVTGLGNGDNGLLLRGNATNNRIEGNFIAKNTAAGVEILSDDYSGEAQVATGNTLTDNRIGLNPAGTAARANGVGVLIANASGNTLRGNLISGNTGAGVQVTIFNSIGRRNAPPTPTSSKATRSVQTRKGLEPFPTVSAFCWKVRLIRRSGASFPPTAT